ncbi:MAG: CHC2 zinc finger domain-containing protein [Candidatus Rickettsiella isopodorum]|jgi:hypothetical protein|nr:hypothetical protein [Pseudomonadota bacterium]
MRSKNSKGLGFDRTQPFHNQTHYHAIPKRSLTPLSNKKRRQFDRNMLPNPREYYAGVLLKFRLRNNNNATALCPFHSDKNPSFSVEFKHGLFFCFSCGASGGDLIDFYRLMTGTSFTKAINYFEAWTYE